MTAILVVYWYSKRDLTGAKKELRNVPDVVTFLDLYAQKRKCFGIELLYATIQGMKETYPAEKSIQ